MVTPSRRRALVAALVVTASAGCAQVFGIHEIADDGDGATTDGGAGDVALDDAAPDAAGDAGEHPYDAHTWTTFLAVDDMSTDASPRGLVVDTEGGAASFDESNVLDGGRALLLKATFEGERAVLRLPDATTLPAGTLGVRMRANIREVPFFYPDSSVEIYGSAAYGYAFPRGGGLARGIVLFRDGTNACLDLEDPAAPFEHPARSKSNLINNVEPIVRRIDLGIAPYGQLKNDYGFNLTRCPTTPDGLVGFVYEYRTPSALFGCIVLGDDGGANLEQVKVGIGPRVDPPAAQQGLLVDDVSVEVLR